MRAFIKNVLVCAAFIIPYPFVKAHIYAPIFEFRFMNILDGVEPFPFAFNIIEFVFSFPFSFTTSCLLICIVFLIEFLIWEESEKEDDERIRLMELKREIIPESFRSNRLREIRSVKAETLAVRYPEKFYELMDRVIKGNERFDEGVYCKHPKSVALSGQYLDFLDIAIKHETYERVYGSQLEAAN